MNIISLTGKSGTGKSFQAMNICRERDIDGIIDDGLFIYNNKVEAGISAKRQKTNMGAFKTALFNQDEHKEQVVSAIGRISPDTILLLATSDRMADRIVERLELPAVSERIHIEDITTEEEREVAGRQRHVQGKHVIPAPTLQLKRHFAGYFLDPMRILKGSGFFSGNPVERTVVRPTFSYMGEFIIYDAVIGDIAECVAAESPGISRILKVYENTAPDSLAVKLDIEMYRQRSIRENAESFQRRITEQIEHMTAFNVVRVNISIRDIVDVPDGVES